MEQRPTDLRGLIEDHGGWLRRLARGLVSNSDDAKDLEQETWIAAWQHPPQRDGTRNWLGKVIKNGWRNQRRFWTRKQTRETAVGRAQAEEVHPSPEEVSERVQMQRRVAAFVSELDEPYRQVVYLRFFEDLESAEIGARLGISAGTVRWRLKVALDDLRGRLDRTTDGKRGAWMAIMVPIARAPDAASPGPSTPGDGSASAEGDDNPGAAPTSSTAGGSAGRPPVLIWASALVLPVATVVALLLWTGRDPGPSIARMPATAGAGGQGPAQALGTTLPPAGPAPAAACPEPVPALHDERARRSAELELRLLPAQAFASGAPNPVAEANFGAVVAGVLERTGRCQHILGCRARICRLELLAPDQPELGLEDCYGGSAGAALLAPHLDRTSPVSQSAGTPTHDPLSKLALRRYEVHYRLARDDGRPLPAPTAPPAPVAPGRHRRLPGLPDQLSASCRQEGERLMLEIQQLWSRGDEVLAPAEAFATSEAEPDPANGRVVAGMIEAATGLAVVEVTCRARVCRAVNLRPVDPATHLPRACADVNGHPRCRLDLQVASWYSRLLATARGSGVVQRTHAPAVEPDGSWRELYLLLRDRSSPSAGPVLPGHAARELVDRLREVGVLEMCERQVGGRGRLEIKLTLPAAADRAAPRISVEHGGDLAGSALGRCVVAKIEAVTEAFSIRPSGLAEVVKRSLVFPGASWARP
jgi:RNA polymerase sigma factor (sigma-70 family)